MTGLHNICTYLIMKACTTYTYVFNNDWLAQHIYIFNNERLVQHIYT